MLNLIKKEVCFPEETPQLYIYIYIQVTTYLEMCGLRRRTGYNVSCLFLLASLTL